MNIDVDGSVVNFATGGVVPRNEDPLVLLIHGAGMDRTVWNLQTRFLAHHGYRALAVDLPGHGTSDGPLLPTVGAMADWVSAVLDHLDGHGGVRLAGHSLGALIAMEVAAARSDVVRLVLLGAAMSMPVHPELLAAAEENSVLAPELMTAWGHGGAAHLATNPTPGMWMLGGGQALLERARPGVIHNDLVAANAYEAGDTPSAVRCPVTVVVGSVDRMTPPRAAASLIDEFDQATTVMLDGIGHSMMSEDPASLRGILLAALA